MDVCNATHRAMARTLREAWDGHDASGYLRWLSDVGPETIADLIDRPTCQIGFDKVHRDFQCTNCGMLFDVNVFDEPDEKGNGFYVHNYLYCPNCGAEVIEGER